MRCRSTPWSPDWPADPSLLVASANAAEVHIERHGQNRISLRSRSRQPFGGIGLSVVDCLPWLTWTIAEEGPRSAGRRSSWGAGGCRDVGDTASEGQPRSLGTRLGECRVLTARERQIADLTQKIGSLPRPVSASSILLTARCVVLRRYSRKVSTLRGELRLAKEGGCPLLGPSAGVSSNSRRRLQDTLLEDENSIFLKW